MSQPVICQLYLHKTTMKEILLLSNKMAAHTLSLSSHKRHVPSLDMKSVFCVRHQRHVISWNESHASKIYRSWMIIHWGTLVVRASFQTTSVAITHNCLHCGRRRGFSSESPAPGRSLGGCPSPTWRMCPSRPSRTVAHACQDVGPRQRHLQVRCRQRPGCRGHRRDTHTDTCLSLQAEGAGEVLQKRQTVG